MINAANFLCLSFMYLFHIVHKTLVIFVFFICFKHSMCTLLFYAFLDYQNCSCVNFASNTPRVSRFLSAIRTNAHGDIHQQQKYIAVGTSLYLR